MGSGASTQKGIDTQIIDKIATDYILSMNFQDMLNMTTESGCSKMIIVVEDILKKNTTEVEIQELAKKKGIFDLSENKPNSSSVFIFPKEEENKTLDIDNSKNKMNLCRQVAKFYVQVANLFSAIIATVNPKYEFKKDGETVRESILNKNKIPEELLSSTNIIFDKNFCSEREELLTSKSNLDNRGEISINLPYCKLNTTLTPYIDTPGIKELEELYKDEYDLSTGLFTMSKKSKIQYEKMVELFYKTMYNRGSPPDNLSKLNIPDYSKENGCVDTKLQQVIDIEVENDVKNENDNENDTDNKNDNDEITIEKDNDLIPPFDDTYIGTNSGLFKDFKDNVLSMKKITSDDSAVVFSKLLIIFDISSNPVQLNPNINVKTINDISQETREAIVKMYLNCETNFQKGLEIFRNIVYQHLTKRTNEEIENLGIIQERVLQS